MHGESASGTSRIIGSGVFAGGRIAESGTFVLPAIYKGMNKTLFFASCFSLGLTFASAQPTAPFDSATTSVARQNYEDTTSQQLRELRRDVDSVYAQTPQAGQVALAPYRDALAAAEQALADYKIASTFDLPQRKKDLDTAKANAMRLWESYRRTHLTRSPDSSSNTLETESTR